MLRPPIQARERPDGSLFAVLRVLRPLPCAGLTSPEGRRRRPAEASEPQGWALSPVGPKRSGGGAKRLDRARPGGYAVIR